MARLANDEQIRELAETCSAQAQAIADGSVRGPRYSAVLRLKNNVETLLCWVGDDRN